MDPDELRERSRCRVVAGSQGMGRREPQADRDGDRLLVVQGERRHRRAGDEAVAALAALNASTG